jgi:hypothetical protein
MIQFLARRPQSRKSAVIPANKPLSELPGRRRIARSGAVSKLNAIRMKRSMRDTETTTRRPLSGWLYTVAAVATIGMLSAAPAFAEDDDEPARDEGIVSNLMRGLGASDGSNGINYRERSPLVVPRQLTLPPPESRRSMEGANWPKDPDVLERRAAREALKKRDKQKENSMVDQQRIQDEPLGASRARTATVAPQPGVSEERRIINEGSGILSPSQLGVTSSLFGLFSTKRDDNKPFTGEPARENLTQPPPGYQTPAANQAYGITNADRVQQNDQMTNPSGILPPGKF